MSFNVEILEESFNKVKHRGDEFAASFYEHLFATNPEVQPLFSNTDMSAQRKKLINSLVLVVENLRNPEALAPVLHALGARHISYGAIPRYYGPVVKSLLFTLAKYLEEDWNPEVKDAWNGALKTVCALMLQPTEQNNSELATPKNSASESVTVANPSAVVHKPIEEDHKPVLVPSNTVALDSLPKGSTDCFPSGDQPKRSLISIQFNGQAFEDILENWGLKYGKLKSNVAGLPWIESIQELPTNFVNSFWNTPTWVVATVAVVIFTLVILVTDSQSPLGKALESTESIGLLVALVLFVKEIPDRRKQFHYQAWSTIDAAHNVKVSYARILALQDLNEDGVSLRGLDAPHAELVKISLSKANLSQANLQSCDLSNADLSFANLDNANLHQAQLSGANLSRANLGFANLSEANLSSANFSHANLICTNLSHTNLSGANLQGSSLSGANLEGAYLTGANLKNAQVSNFELSNAFLDGAIMPDGSRYKPSSPS